MNTIPFPVIDLAATGRNIQRLREERGLTVRDLQAYFGFEEPQAIYKWQKGKSLPTVDNLYALAALLQVTVDDILVPLKFHILSHEQQVARFPHILFHVLRVDELHKIPAHSCSSSFSTKPANSWASFVYSCRQKPRILS